MKKKLWIAIPAVTIVACALGCALFWDTLSMYLIPKTKLSKALTNTVQMVTERFAESPVAVLGKGIDSAGRSTAIMKADTTHDVLGNVTYQMTLMNRLSPRQVLAEGNITAGDQFALELSLYLDSEYAAVSSKELLGSQYYGIRYRTFAEDIRSKGLISYLIGEETIAGWEDKIGQLSDFMGKRIEVPTISENDVKLLMTGLLTLKCDVSRRSITLDEQVLPAYEVCLSTSGAQISMGMDYLSEDLRSTFAKLLPGLTDADSEIIIRFLLWNEKVIEIDGQLAGNSGTKKFLISLGNDPIEDDMVLEYFDDSGKEGKLTISTAVQEHIRREGVVLVQDDEVHQYWFEWDTSSGVMDLQIDIKGRKDQITLFLKEIDDGFIVSSEHFERIIALITGTEGETGESVNCTMTVTAGADIKAPTYKNIDVWSVEDLLRLLEGLVGPLLSQ